MEFSWTVDTGLLEMAALAKSSVALAACILMDFPTRWSMPISAYFMIENLLDGGHGLAGEGNIDEILGSIIWLDIDGAPVRWPIANR